MKKRITVIKEDDKGRNIIFRDNLYGKDLSREQLVRKIKQGIYRDYHIRIINKVETPVSNPDKSEKNNLD